LESTDDNPTFGSGILASVIRESLLR